MTALIDCRLRQVTDHSRKRLRITTKQLWITLVGGILLAACRSANPGAPPPANGPTAAGTTASPMSPPTTEPTLILQGTGPEQADVGREVYQRACAGCHGLSAEGYANETRAPALDGSEHASHHPDQQLHDWIVNGKLGLGRGMPGFGGQLDDGEVHAIIAYLHTLWTPDQLAIQQDISRRWPSTPEPTWTPGP